MNNERLLALANISDVATRIDCCLSAFEIIRYSVECPEQISDQFLNAISAILFHAADLSKELTESVNRAYAVEGFIRGGGKSWQFVTTLVGSGLVA